MSAVLKADVAIYGGGQGGAFLARDSEKRGHKVVLVDQHTYFEVCSSVVRSSVNPDFAKRALIPSKGLSTEGQVVHGKSSELRRDGSGVVQVRDSSSPNGFSRTSTVKAKAAVSCTGQHYRDSAPRASSEPTIADRLKFYERFAAEIERGDTIVVAGGGPAGVEFAAEVVSKYGSKKRVTIVNSGPRLSASTTPSAGRVAIEFLTKHGVEIINNTKVVKTTDDSKNAVSSDGRIIEADAIFWATGGTPNSEFMRAHWQSSSNERCEILVDAEFAVKRPADQSDDRGSRHSSDSSSNDQPETQVFAFGDVAFLDKQPKLAWLTGSQWPIVAYNADEVVKGSTKRRMYATRHGDPRMGITLGPDEGVFESPYVGTISWNWFARMAKSRDMMVGSHRKRLGLADA